MHARVDIVDWQLLPQLRVDSEASESVASSPSRWIARRSVISTATSASAWKTVARLRDPAHGVEPADGAVGVNDSVARSVDLARLRGPRVVVVDQGAVVGMGSLDDVGERRRDVGREFKHDVHTPLPLASAPSAQSGTAAMVHRFQAERARSPNTRVMASTPTVRTVDRKLVAEQPPRAPAVTDAHRTTPRLTVTTASARTATATRLRNPVAGCPLAGARWRVGVL